jgi:dihydrofolate synthase/folylpolyglutamate synthase
MERAARDAVMERSRENMATVATIGGDILYEISRQSPEGIALRVRGTRDSYGGLFLPLLGRHQAANCAAAIGAIEGLRSIGLEISPQAVREGVASVRWPGRMELLGRDPLFLVDCAHNPSAARAVAGGVGEIFPRLRWVLILGVLGDKDIEGICEALLPLASDIVTTRVRSERSAEPGRIASVCRGRTRAGVYEAKGLREALGLARTIVTDGRAEGIFLTGSTYLVGEALALAGRPLPLFP